MGVVMAEFKLPEGNKRWLWIGGLGAAALVFWWWRRGAETAPAETDTSQLPGTGTGYVNPNPNASGHDEVDDGTDDGPLTGPQWSQKVILEMPLYGWEPDFVARTLGKYFAGAVLNANEAELIRSAWALFGKPAGAPAINTGGSTTPPPASGRTPKPTPEGPRPPRPPGAVTAPRLSPYLPARRALT